MVFAVMTMAFIALAVAVLGFGLVAQPHPTGATSATPAIRRCWL
jgi:hypothetical protein